MKKRFEFHFTFNRKKLVYLSYWCKLITDHTVNYRRPDYRFYTQSHKSKVTLV